MKGVFKAHVGALMALDKLKKEMELAGLPLPAPKRPRLAPGHRGPHAAAGVGFAVLGVGIRSCQASAQLRRRCVPPAARKLPEQPEWCREPRCR